MVDTRLQFSWDRTNTGFRSLDIDERISFIGMTLVRVAAVQIGHPIQSFILMKTNDPAFHAVMLARKKLRSRRANDTPDLG